MDSPGVWNEMMSWKHSLRGVPGNMIVKGQASRV